jgi:alanine dehydrogenase
MIVGILKEIKVLENRVFMTPDGVIAMKKNGHDVLVEKNAGAGAGFPDAEYVASGAAMADAVIGAVLVAGAKAPKLLTRKMLKTMKKRSVIVDVAIDQGGCFETPKAATHSDPTFEVDGVVHYCVANMPGAVAKTSTAALTNATLPYAIEIANKGWEKAMQENKEIKRGANVIRGQVTYKAVADAFGLDYTPIENLL